MKYNTIKIRSARWPRGHLKADFYISTELAGRVLELIGVNLDTPHVVNELPPQPRDDKGHFTKVADPVCSTTSRAKDKPEGVN